MYNCKNNGCKNTVKTNRGKSGFCQPCSARILMNDRWSSKGDASKGAIRHLDSKCREWLLNQASTHKVKLSVLVASIIKDAYVEEFNIKPKKTWLNRITSWYNL